MNSMEIAFCAGVPYSVGGRPLARITVRRPEILDRDSYFRTAQEEAGSLRLWENSLLQCTSSHGF